MVQYYSSSQEKRHPYQMLTQPDKRTLQMLRCHSELTLQKERPVLNPRMSPCILNNSSVFNRTVFANLRHWSLQVSLHPSFQYQQYWTVMPNFALKTLFPFAILPSTNMPVEDNSPADKREKQQSQYNETCHPPCTHNHLD